MRSGFPLVLLALSCSGGTTESEAYEPRGEVLGPQPDFVPVCTANCVLSHPDLAGGGPYCWSLDEASCNAAPGGWITRVPACGESDLWLQKCAWNPSGGCVIGPMFVKWQTCEP
jgi:hypothetical protein